VPKTNDYALLHLGFATYIPIHKITAVMKYNSTASKRLVREARDSTEPGKFVDATHGRRTNSVVILDNGAVIACPVKVETLHGRLQNYIEER